MSAIYAHNAEKNIMRTRERGYTPITPAPLFEFGARGGLIAIQKRESARVVDRKLSKHIIMKVSNVFCKVMSSVSPVLGYNNTVNTVKFVARQQAAIKHRKAVIELKMEANKVSVERLKRAL